MFTLASKTTRLSIGAVLIANLLVTGSALAQQSAPENSPKEKPAVETVDPKITPPIPAQAPADKRIFGVLPNYRTVNGTVGIEPITSKQKFHIAFKDSFDWPGYMVGGAFAALYQLEDSNPSFGQGLKGYAHRYVTAYADQVIGNMMVEGLLPSVLHEDPRYFRLGEGTKWHRFRYSATRILVTRTDSGKSRFNTSEVLGNGLTASIANAYYPDSRTFSDTTQRMYMQLATDAFSNVMKEFWPDLKRHFSR